ncbi:MAG: hypothetical protein KME09_00130 [Pleurocapsa minor HA4230-MV1]|nr:hypothetical protein [Pleurocapsa minor HA4230-MV1]
MFSTPSQSKKLGIEGEHLLCMNLRGDTNYYKFTGETANGAWGKYISHELSAELSSEWSNSNNDISSLSAQKKIEIENLHRERLKAKAEQNKQAVEKWRNALLNEDDRDREIRKVLQSLSISDRDYENLKQRGFSREQIIDYQYKSVQAEQPIEKTSNLLAGVTADGHNLSLKIPALLIPIKNNRGKYTGWQYRGHTTSKHKYFWAKTEVESRDYNITSHDKKNLELPLAYCLPHSGRLDSEYIGLTEAIGFKCQLAANKYNQIVIGASGGLFTSSPKTFEEYLSSASKTLNSQKVVLYPDAGAVKNPAVIRQYARAIDFLQQKKYSPQFAWWGQTDKQQHHDIDEREDRQFLAISPDYFYNLGKLYSGYHPRDELQYRHKVNRAIGKNDRVNINVSNSKEQERIAKVTSVLANYLKLNQKSILENQSSILGIDWKTKTIVFQNKIDQSEFLRAEFEPNRKVWIDKGSNLSPQKEQQIFESIVPKLENKQKNICQRTY